MIAVKYSGYWKLFLYKAIYFWDYNFAFNWSNFIVQLGGAFQSEVIAFKACWFDALRECNLSDQQQEIQSFPHCSVKTIIASFVRAWQ